MFIDDYHKYRTHFDQIFEFLGLLQILKNNLTRENLKCGFIVSGTQAWNSELQRDGHLRGFLDGTPIEMPQITPEMVSEVFNRRIQAYCYEEFPRRIKSEFVTAIFKQIPAKAGYRDYLGRIIKELDKNNWSIVDTPIELASDTLAEIKKIIEANDDLKASFNKLIYGAKFKRYTQEQIRKCLELLIQTSIHEGINELDRLFDDNKYYFNLLRESALIQKRRRKLADGTDSFDWVIHSRLQSATETVRKKFPLTLSDYLLKIYGKRDPLIQSQEIIAIHHESELAPVIKFFARIDLALPLTAVTNVRTALRLFDGILLTDEAMRPTDEQIRRAWDAFTLLSDGFFELDGSRRLFNSAAISDVEDRWHFHLIDDEGLLELLNRHEDYISQPEERARNGSLVYKQLRDVFPALATRLKVMAEDLADQTFFGLSCHTIQHSKVELALLEKVRNGYFSAVGASHYDYIRAVTDYLELKLRNFLYACTTLLFGESSYVSQMPNAFFQYAQRNISTRTSYGPFENAYAGLTRGQLRGILEGPNNINRLVLNSLELGWNTSDWRKFLEEFVVANINSSHQQTDAYSPVNKELYLNYCRRAEELIASLNSLLKGIVKNNTYLIYTGGERSNPENYFFKYCLPPHRPKSNQDSQRVREDIPEFLSAGLIAENMLSNEAYNRVFSMLVYKIETARRNILVEDLAEVEYIANGYNLSYQEFMHSIAFASFVDRKIVVQPWFGSSIIIRAAAK